jgi:hypothetical protein
MLGCFEDLIFLAAAGLALDEVVAAEGSDGFASAAAAFFLRFSVASSRD